MNERFISLEALNIPAGIINDIKSIDRHSLVGSTSFGPKECRQMFWSSFSLSDYWAFAKEYGFWFDRICTTDYHVLPDDLTMRVTDVMSEFFQKDLSNEIVIRLQSMHGRQGTAWHIDPTRTASLIYPIEHQSSSKTCFYQPVLDQTNGQEGMVNPKYYEYIDGVVINRYPALLNVKQVHAVMFNNDTYTKETPRLSLTVKWRTRDFEQVVNDLC